MTEVGYQPPILFLFLEIQPPILFLFHEIQPPILFLFVDKGLYLVYCIVINQMLR